MSDEVQDQIAALRAQIDDIDKQVVRLLNERAALALKIRDLKPKASLSLYDPKREEQIFENLSKWNDGPLFAENLRDIYETLLHVMKEL